MYHVWWRGDVHREFSWRDLKKKRPLGRPRCRWDDNIKMDVQEVVYWDVDWIDLVENRLL